MLSYPDPAPQSRLDGWKEIASYLRREVRTVQRWEAKEGLPVHRHFHDTQVTVYAYPGELDAWLAQRLAPKATAEERLPAAELRKPRWSVNWRILVALGLCVILVTVAIVWLGKRTRARLGFQARDWVLLAGFENRTGEPLFEGTLQYALERELSHSRFVNVMAPEQTGDALRLMKKPPDSKIDVATAREICLREGGIKALVTGRAEKFGSTYVFTVQLVEPDDGRTLAASEEQAAGQEQVWPAVRKLSNWVRQSLGEQIAGLTRSQRLQQVTTPSLRALQLYTQAEALGRTDPLPRRWGTSEKLVRQALESDPEFASAWIWLAWCLRNEGKTTEECRPYAEKAVALSETASDRERLFILGNYYGFITGEREKAVEAYAALLQLYPDDFWGRQNLIWVSSAEEQAGLMASYADLRPNDFRKNLDAAMTLFNRDPSRARYYADRARAVLTTEDSLAFPAEETELKLFSVHEAWFRDDPKSGLEELDHLMRDFDSMDLPHRELLAHHAGLCYLGFGKIKTAQGWFQKLESPSRVEELLAVAAFADGDDRLGWAHASRFFAVQSAPEVQGYWAGIVLPRTGTVTAPDAFLQYFGGAPSDPDMRDHILVHLKGELALSQGKTADAIHMLQQAVDNYRQDQLQYILPAVEGLSLAFERNGQTGEALRVLREASEQRFLEWTWESPYGVFWLRIQARLARLYRQTGRVDEARKIEKQLRRILAYADADHPIVIQLKASL